MVTSTPSSYHTILPHLGPAPGGAHGAQVLGAHAEGPFISRLKKGAHTEEYIRDLSGGYEGVRGVYGPALDDGKVRIVTLAPEHDPEGEVVRRLAAQGVAVSVGHSMATLAQGEMAVTHGATLITHLFNAMASFHHRLVNNLCLTEPTDFNAFFSEIPGC